MANEGFPTRNVIILGVTGILGPGRGSHPMYALRFSVKCSTVVLSEGEKEFGSGTLNIRTGSLFQGIRKSCNVLHHFDVADVAIFFIQHGPLQRTTENGHLFTSSNFSSNDNAS